MKISRFLIATSFCLVLLLLGLAPVMAEDVGSGSFQKDTGIDISFGLPVDEAWAKNPANYDVYEKSDPDIKIAVDSVTLDPRRTSATLRFKEPLNLAAEYVVDAKNVTSDGKVLGARQFTVKKSETQVLFGLLLGAMLISNFVFTKYLGLCIFFGVSQKKDTAIGMGITFTTVMILSAIMCWALLTFVLQPYNLGFLRIIVLLER